MERPDSVRMGTIAFATVVAVALYHVLPDSVVVVNDDFGYVRSIVHTVVRGRPFTDAWLEPWAASFSALGAAIFRVSGSMRLATYGQVAIAVGVALGFGAALLRDRGVRPVPAALLALLALTTPTLLFKTFELGAMPLYLACLLVTLWASEHDRPGLAAIAIVVALASRQSALLSAGIAVAAFAERDLRATPRAWRRLARDAAIVTGSACLAYVICKVGMNETHAQRVMMPSLLSTFSPGAFARHAGLALALYVVAVGVGAGVLALACPSAGRPSLRAAHVALAVAALGVTLAPLTRVVALEHDLFGGVRGRAYVTALGALAVVGFLVGRPRVRPAYAIAALGFALVLGLRATVWDYYFLDVVALGLLSPVPAPVAASASGARRHALAALALAVFLGFHASFVGASKRRLDDAYATLALAERALAASAITEAELGLSPFGHQGFHLYPYFIAHEGADGEHIAGFLRYVSPDATRMVVTDARLGLEGARSAVDLAQERIVVSDVFDFGWTKRRRYTLTRRYIPAPAERAIDFAALDRTPYPMTDAAWRRHVQAARRRLRP